MKKLSVALVSRICEFFIFCVVLINISLKEYAHAGCYIAILGLFALWDIRRVFEKVSDEVK